jgi:zinc transport system substrate-binding protein
VLASIPPVHSLVASVMEGVGQPDLLVPATASDHDYAMRPSDARKVERADLVVWIGTTLETYLVKLLSTEGVATVELLSVPGVNPIPFTDHHSHGEKGEDHAHESATEHDSLELDPHVWLDPVRAQVIVRVVAAKLTEIDPEHAATYEQNAIASIEGLKALDSSIRQQLAPVASEPFVTFHDGYSYFAQRYGLNQVGSLTLDPDQRSGAASVRALRNVVSSQHVSCAFTEPQFDPATVQKIAGDTGMRVRELDALGVGLETGPSLYRMLLERNTDAIESCLGPNS